MSKPRPKLVMTLGLPGSGKSTWARSIVRENTGWSRVNKDDLRNMLNDGLWNKVNERTVVRIQQETVISLLLAGQSVIVDNTNFGKWETFFRSLAQDCSADFKIQDFTHVPLETCIKNDLNRRASVGKDVIMRMYNQFLKPEPEVIEPIEDLPWAILVDVDGTLAHLHPGADGTVRDIYDGSRVFEDRCDVEIRRLVNREYKAGTKVVIMSGRDSRYKDVTKTWLNANGVSFDEIYMRPEGDKRKDSIVKRELFDTHIRGNFNIRYVLDDRNQVVDEWRAMGLKVLQVAEGDF